MSGPSERQIHKFRRDYAIKQQEQVLDVFLAVDRLHALATHALKKLTTKVEYEWRIVVQGAYPGQVDAKQHKQDCTRRILCMDWPPLSTECPALSDKLTINLQACTPV
ncbi:hypothetical protein ABBQ38_15494 [Trebouxia sp. C0009 RCD-2024]